jgi:hypothetical protein
MRRSLLLGSLSLLVLASCSEPPVMEGLDAGTSDRVVPPMDSGNGGGGDGSVRTDGGGSTSDVVLPTRCNGDEQCDDSNRCTVDTCDTVTNMCRSIRDVSRCECDPACMTTTTGGMGGRPFSEEGQRGVEFDAASGGLLVRAESRRADYLWVPNVNESTLSKWDATMAREIARYRVGIAAGECRGQCCHANGCNMPSRVVVDGFGDVYAANRGFGMQGTVTKIAADQRDCVDRNGNGMIDTSTGPMDVRPFDQDECVLWTANVGAPNVILRSIAVDRGDEMFPQGYPWVGSCADASFGSAANAGLFKLNPRTGALIRTAPMGRCAYGAVVTADGTLWEHALGEGIIPVNVTSGEVGALVPEPVVGSTLRPQCNAANTWERSYGITADARGRVWLSGSLCSDVIGYDPAMRAWSRMPAHQYAGVPYGTFVGSGVTVDPSNRVWAPMSGNPFRLFSFDSDAFVPNGLIPQAAVTVHSIARAWGSSAIGADRSGMLWVATSDPGPLLRYNPMTRAADTFDGPNRVYTYTDFTGAVRRLVIGTGTYTDLYMACPGALWAELRWDATLPMGTSLVFNVQFAETLVGLGSAMPIALATTARDTSPVDIQTKLRELMMTNPGRFARLTVTFNPSTSPVASPVLRAVSLAWRCPGEG